MIVVAAFLAGAAVSIIGGFKFVRWLFDGEYLP